MKQKLEEVQLNMTVNLQEMGLNDNMLDQIQANIMQDNFDMADMTNKIVEYLVLKIEQIDSPIELRTANQITEIHSS